MWFDAAEEETASDAISLRPITEADLEMLRAHRNADSTRVWLADTQLVTPEVQQQRFAAGCFEAFRIAEDHGPIGLARVGVSGKERWVGCDVFQKFRGRGFGHRIFKAACVFAGRDPVVETLRLKVFLANAPAMRIYTRAGFTIDKDVPVEFYVRGIDALARLEPYIAMSRQRKP